MKFYLCFYLVSKIESDVFSYIVFKIDYLICNYLKSLIYKPLAIMEFSILVLSRYISTCIFSLLFFFEHVSCMILTTGIRARRNSPQYVKMESSKIGIKKFDVFDNEF